MSSVKYLDKTGLSFFYSKVKDFIAGYSYNKNDINSLLSNLNFLPTSGGIITNTGNHFLQIKSKTDNAGWVGIGYSLPDKSLGFLGTSASGEPIFVNSALTTMSTILHSGNYNNYAVTRDGANASGTWGINITGNAATSSNATIADSASSVSNSLKFGSKTYNGSSEQTITATDLGLSAALKYIGTTTTALFDDSTAKTIVIGGSNHTATNGDVVFYNNKEFIWNGSAWEEFGFNVDLSGYKPLQSVVQSPDASGYTTAFIDTIYQSTDGKITVTKKNVSFPTLPDSLKNPKSLTINNSDGISQVSYDGSEAKSLTLTKSMVGLSNVNNTADANKEVKYAATATNLDNNPSLSKGTSDTNKITVTAGGKTSTEFTVPYATNSISLDGHNSSKYLRNEIMASNSSFDANDMSTSMRVYTPSSDIGTKATAWNNFPTTSAPAGGFGLLTIAEGGYKRQIFGAYNDNHLYVRSQNYSNGIAWKDWNKIAFTTDIPTSLPANGGTATYATRLGDSNSYYTKATLDSALAGKQATITNNVTYSGNLTSASGQVTVFDGTTGTIKASGYTIAKSVPSDAKFTDNNTTYTFAGGTNSFTVTSSGGTKQTISVTPSISVATTSANGLMSSADKTKLDGAVTKIKINGVDKTASNGVVDLGTVGGECDFTNAYKTKLDSIASGAEVNVQANWNETDSASDAFIQNKPTIPTNTSQLNNDSNFTTATGHNHDSSYLKSYDDDTMTGNLTVTGKVSSAGGFFHTSDETLKNFIGDVDVDLDKLAALPKKYFTWKDGDDSVQIGTSAQEVQKVYPEIVNTDDTGKLSVDYTKLSVIALSAVDKLNEKNKELENRLHAIELLLSKLNISE